jgi:hypothetical protein
MVRKLLIAVPIILFAFGVLFVSILRTAALRYEYNGPMNENKGYLSTLESKVEYILPYPGSILPDHPLWFLKVIRDRVWYLITTNQERKIELLILFADKRLGSSKMLFEKNNPNVGLVTLEKAERYLLEASQLEERLRNQGVDTSLLVDRLARASLRHYEIMELMYESAPDELRPSIVTFQAIPEKVYEDARNASLNYGITPYKNPFE